MQILKGRKEQRVSHWKDIHNRVTTHEGEFLTGKKAEHYRNKWSYKYLGKDLSKPLDVRKPEYQKELEK